MRAQHVRFALGEQGFAPGREFRRVEGSAIGVKYPDVFMVTAVRFGLVHQSSVHGGHRGPVRKTIVIHVNSGGHGGVVEGHIVRKDYDEIHHGWSRRGADTRKRLLTILRQPFVLVGRKSVRGKKVGASGVFVGHHVRRGIFVFVGIRGGSCGTRDAI